MLLWLERVDSIASDSFYQTFVVQPEYVDAFMKSLDEALARDEEPRNDPLRVRKHNQTPEQTAEAVRRIKERYCS